MNVREFAVALTNSLDALDKVAGVEDRAAAAERRVQAAEARLSEASEAHAKLRADSDAHLAKNLDTLNAETVRHNDLVNEARKKMAKLDELHKTQIDNAGGTLTKLNTDVGLLRKQRDDLAIEIEKHRNTILDLAKKL
jgi:chromosome segregation ATPase